MNLYIYIYIYFSVGWLEERKGLGKGFDCFNLLTDMLVRALSWGRAVRNETRQDMEERKKAQARIESGLD